MRLCLLVLLGAGVISAWGADFVNGPIVRKVIVNERSLEGRAEWQVTGLGVFTCYINGHEVGAEDRLKPGYTEVLKRRAVYTYDVTDYLNKGAGETNVFWAVVTDGWWSDRIVSDPKKPRRHCAFYARGIVETDATWEATTNTPAIAGIYEGEKWDDAKRLHDGRFVDALLETTWTQATVNEEFRGELTPVVGGRVAARAALPCVKRWRTSEGKTVYDFGQNCAGVPRFTLKGKPGAVFRYRLGEILNDGIKGHHGDGPKDTVYLANLRGAAVNMSFTFGERENVVYEPRYTFYGYRYLQVEDNPEVEIASVESVPLSSISEQLDRGSLEAGDPSLNRFIQNARWGMLSNYLSIPTDCPQRDERYGWTGDTQVFSETGLYFADVKDFFRKWLFDLRDAQLANGCYPVVAPRGRWNLSGGQAAWSDAGVVVPYRIWRSTGDRSIIRAQRDSMMRFVDYLEKTNYEMKRGNWMLCDWLSFEKLSVDQRSKWSNGSLTDDHLSYQNFLNACYAVSDCQMLGEMLPCDPERPRIRKLEHHFREKLAARWLKPDGSLVELFDGMMTPRLMVLKIGAGDTGRHARELVELIRANGNRLSTGFVGTSELTEQLSRQGHSDIVWDVLMNHDFPGWLYSVDQGATTIWERWNGYTKDKGFGDVGMNSYNHYAYGSVVGWLFKYAAGIQPGKDGGYASFTLAPHPDKRAGSLKATYDTPQGRIVSHWWYEGDRLKWNYEVPKGSKVEIVPPTADGRGSTTRLGAIMRR